MKRYIKNPRTLKMEEVKLIPKNYVMNQVIVCSAIIIVLLIITKIVPMINYYLKS